MQEIAQLEGQKTTLEGKYENEKEALLRLEQKQQPKVSLGFTSDADDFLQNKQNSPKEEQPELVPVQEEPVYVNQDPQYFLKLYDSDDLEKGAADEEEFGINTSQRRRDQLLADISFHRSKVVELCRHGYHVAERSQHNGGVHHREYLAERRKLESAMFDYAKIIEHV